MNITVAVGLIAAGSTLAGGLIASVTSLKVQGKQLREQNVLLKAERQERQNAERRSIRRDAYTAFLNQLDKVDELMDVWWPGSTLVEEDLIKRKGDISDVANALVILENLANIVSLEGPEAAELAAKNATTTFKDALIDLAVERIHEGGGVEIDKGKQDQSNTVRMEAKAAFIEAARKGLE